MTDKYHEALRITIKKIRGDLSIPFQRKISKKVCDQIKPLEAYRYAKHIALYHAINREIDLSPIWKSAPLQGKFCYFPVMMPNKTLSFMPATPKTPFKKNKYHILEPDVPEQKPIPLSYLDLVFMPLVSFDEEGNRLGMGQGYYDKTFRNQKKPLLIGLAYEFQKQNYLFPKSWDVPLDLIITEKQIYWT